MEKKCILSSYSLASNSNIIRIILSECLTIERRANMLIVVDLAGSLGYVIFTGTFLRKV